MRPAAYPACAPTWRATTASSRASSTTARPTTAAATNPTNPPPTVAPAPQPAPSAHRLPWPAQEPARATPHATSPPDPTHQDHLSTEPASPHQPSPAE